MPVYTGFNLATQGRNGQPPNATQNYYTGLNRPNPIGNQLGNQTGAGTGTVNPAATPAPNAGQGWTQGQDARPYLQQFLGTRNPNGTAGFNLENAFGAGTAGNGYDPRLYNYGLTRTPMSEGGDNYSFNGNPAVNTRGLITRNGQEYVQAGEFLDRIIDPSQVIYDEEFGLLTGQGNLHNPESHLTRAMPYIVGAGLAAPVAAAAGAFGAAGSAVPAAETAAGVGTASQVGVPSAAAEIAANTAAAGGAAAPAAGGLAGTQVVGPVAYEGAAAGATAAGAAGAGGTGMTTAQMIQAGGSLLGTVANAIGNRQNANQYRSDINSAVERADTWGPENRQRAIDRIWQLYNDPSSIASTPGYAFAQQQGEQGVNRASASRGYFRSPNMLYDLSKFNQGLATKTYDSEMSRLMAMAGVNNNPANAASLAAQGAGQYSSMNRASLTSALAAGGTFMDWLSGLNFG